MPAGRTKRSPGPIDIRIQASEGVSKFAEHRLSDNTVIVVTNLGHQSIHVLQECNESLRLRANAFKKNQCIYEPL